MNNSFVLAIDQGTSSTKTLVFDAQGQVIAKGSEPLKTFYKDNGFVEQDPEEIYQNVLASVKKCLDEFIKSGHAINDIKACGISNQRETFVLWNKDGTPLHNAVVWQCKRSVQICEQMKAEGWQESIQSKTGLLVDPYFSGSKVVWLYENDERIKEIVDEGEAFFGTVDCWLLYKLTNGKCYATDYTNASRTLFFNLSSLSWDEELLRRFKLKNLNLPNLQPSSSFFGESTFSGLSDHPIPITGIIGDSHAAAFGEGCYQPGEAKATLGTGCSILMNIGNRPKPSANGMVTTICWSTEDRVDYALEGVIVSCGATIEWLKNNLQLFADSKETEAIATSVPDNGDVYIIPAFSGLGAPYWDMKRKASIEGLTFGTTKAYIVRAALESIPFQIKDVVTAMEIDAAIKLNQLMIDGGISSNEFVVQFLADLLNEPVVTIGQPDVSALGAAYIAGLKAGVYKDINQLAELNSYPKIYQPKAENKTAIAYEGWKAAIRYNK